MVELQAALQPSFPHSVAIGKGNALRLMGWCTAGFPVRQLALLVNGEAQPVRTWLPQPQSTTHSYDFWAIVPMQERESNLEFGLRAVLSDGQIVQRTLARVAVETLTALPPQEKPHSRTPLIAICMAAYKPDLQLFRRQLETIRAQTWPNWRCLIRDDGSGAAVLEEMRQIIGADERFVLIAAPERRGFYQNFERCLALAPPEAEFIALADQDDEWYPHKLQRAVEQFEAATLLVYSDLRVVSKTGELISPTFWQYRQNNFTDLGALLLVNSVPGAGTMFRRRLLDYVLPFPPQEQTIFHDHWIAVVALTLGIMKYVDEPLYDWIQHGTNAGGFGEKLRPTYRSYWAQLRRTAFTANGKLAGRGIYETHILPLALLARVAAMRCLDVTSPAKQHVLKRAAELDHAWRSMVWLAARGLGDWQQRDVTNGMEYYFLNGALWRQLAHCQERGRGLLRHLNAMR